MLPKIGRPSSTLDDNGIFILDSIEETDQLSKSQIHYTCEFGHESTSRLDTIKSWINLYDDNKRYAVCADCNLERAELNNLMINENLVSDRGFLLVKMYSNDRCDIIYDIKCKNNHVTIGRSKGSFMRSFTCKECKKTSEEYKCSDCQKILPLNKFNKCETNTYRNGTDHHCRDCRDFQRQVRKDSGYKLPSKETITIDDVSGKICTTKDCGFHPYSEYWSDVNNIDKYDKYCKKCKTKINSKYCESNIEKIKEIGKTYRKNNRERITLVRNRWKNKNREKYNEIGRIYMKKRRDDDPDFKLLTNLRHRMNLALKNGTKSGHTLSLIGCSIEELWEHLETKFCDGMSRETYGLWHIDHIKPCTLFDLTDEREQRRCFNYKNLQPMIALENITKGCKYKFNVVHEIELRFIN